MKTAMLNIKIDPRVKMDAQLVADELGFSLSSIISATLKNLARTKTVSFSLLEPTPLLQDAIRASRKERQDTAPQHFTSASAMLDSLVRE